MSVYPYARSRYTPRCSSISTRFCAFFYPLHTDFYYHHSIVETMSQSQTPATTTSNSNYQTIFDKALEAYKRKTKKDLRSHPLLSKLESCGTPDTVLATLREQIPGSNQSGDDKWTKWLNPTVNVLYNFSEVIGGGISLVRVRSFLE